MANSEAERIHKKSVIVEGHRDIFEKFHLEKQGQHHPVLNVTLPRLKRANISTTFYSVCGDSLTHVRGTYRYLSSALENIDASAVAIELDLGWHEDALRLLGAFPTARNIRVGLDPIGSMATAGGSTNPWAQTAPTFAAAIADCSLR